MLTAPHPTTDEIQNQVATERKVKKSKRYRNLKYVALLRVAGDI